MEENNLEGLTKKFGEIRTDIHSRKHISDSYLDSWRISNYVSSDEKVGAAIVTRHVESSHGGFGCDEEYNGVIVFDKDRVLKPESMEKWYFSDTHMGSFNKKELQIFSILSARQIDKGYEVQYKTADEKIHTVKG